MMKKNELAFFVGLACLAVSQSMVGLNIISSKYLLDHVPFLFLLTIRFIFSTFLLLPLHWLSADSKITLKAHFKNVTRADWLFLLAQALCAGVLFNFFMMCGLKNTDANVAGIITSALPAIIALSWRILGDKFSLKTAVCIGFATIGLLIIALSKFKNLNAEHSFWGDFIVLLSLLPEAIYYVLCQLHPNKLPVFLTSALLNGINALVLLCLFPLNDLNMVTLHLEDWLILLMLGLNSGLFFVFWFIGSKKVTGIMAALSTAVMPVATVLLAWFFLGEKLTLVQGVGMGFVLLSILAYAKR
jgi:drug/metabolite transporter (DMT)-like permease